MLDDGGVMLEPKPPANEPERLAELVSLAILDTVPEPVYDEIVKLASMICQTPIALVSLVDAERQWFKAKLGLDGSEGPRSTSFCGHVVERGQTMVVHDARADPRFADNPAVLSDPYVVYYAGAPLATTAGHTLGTLCVVDSKPRELTREQLDMLDGLARVVVSLLEVRHIELARTRAEAAAEAARAASLAAERLRRRFFDMSFDMLCVASFEGRFTEVNGAWTRVLGWSQEEMCAKPFIEFVHPDDRERTIAETIALVGGDHITVHFANRYEAKSGEYLWLEWTAVPDLENRVLLAAARDVTANKQNERLLIEARHAAESANAAKSDFLAKMSHELRTPLNSVIGFTNLLRKNKGGKFDARDLMYLDKIGKNGVHLLSLINDLLDLSKIEAGRTELELAPIELASFCESIHDELEGALQAHGNSLRVEVPERLAPLSADGRRLKQILINLIGNANKFTSGGAIELCVYESATTPGHAERIDVIDSGIGIPADALDMVFEAFRQVSEGDGRTHGGTGLGLAISRSLAILHGFDLGVVSEVGQGTTFYLRLRPDTATPRHRPPRPPASPTRDRSESSASFVHVQGQRTVLLIEDDSEARLFAAQAVEQVGARVVTADSGESGLKIAAALLPDLILLDLGLPDVHGRELVRQLSNDPQLRHIPVVIYSADSDPVEGVRSTSVLEKPSTLEEMSETLARHLGTRQRVLIVDDDDDTREMLSSMVELLGLIPRLAADGRQALELLRSHGADLVLLDICMPGMSGFEFLEELRADPVLADTPVVVCTALEVENAAQLAHTRGFIRKGYNLEGRLEEIVHQVFRPTT